MEIKLAQIVAEKNPHVPPGIKKRPERFLMPRSAGMKKSPVYSG
ncbi:hypothetical protein BN1221_02076c [Brenneria goodwinii]|uniref:Uncharacterized protein n=1 Tax=Brenneria goodwinii TaxID=1109412 RepID=A0A0G4JUP9_9GAMM|nr:hypothetical protein BN1221_02076c [Brenneria goodwinii]